MANPARASFQAALIRYRRARAEVKAGQSERQRDRAIAKLDEALDLLISSPSPSLGAFGAKIQILEAEYGIEAQPRHWQHGGKLRLAVDGALSAVLQMDRGR